jgi:ketosteroid isomerase-like protein
VTAADERAIERALCSVATALDSRDWAALGAAFTEDARGYSKVGRDAVVAQVRAHLGGCGPSQHLLGNIRVTVDGDTASSLTYARVYHVGAGERAGTFYECIGEYTDSWTRTPSGWLLTFRWFDVRIELGDRSVLRPG